MRDKNQGTNKHDNTATGILDGGRRLSVFGNFTVKVLC